MSRRNRTLQEDVEMLMEPIDERGNLNPCCGDGYFAISCEKKWGKERFDEACKEYRKIHRR